MLGKDEIMAQLENYCRFIPEDDRQWLYKRFGEILAISLSKGFCY